MKLHIGGHESKAGWKILNIQAGPAVDYVGDLRDLSQFADASFEEVYASHVLEHVAQAQVVPTLRGVRRILQPGGRLMVSVPDLDVLCQSFVSPFASPDVKFHVMRMIFGGQVDAHDFHYMGFNQEFLAHFLREAGFSSSQRVASFGLFKDTSEFRPYGFPISLNMVAIR
jgi:predicted SAM-dependent methyltransferase